METTLGETNALKLLYLPLGDQPGLETAFSQVFHRTDIFYYLNYTPFDVIEPLLREVDNFVPDILHIQATDHVSPSTIGIIRKRFPKLIITQWLGDQRKSVIDYVVEHGRQLDLTLISNTGQLDDYRNAGCQRVDYWQHAANREIDFVDNPLPWEERQNGIVFCGHNYGENTFPASKERIDLCRALTEAFPDFRVYGRGWEGMGVRQGTPSEIPWYEQAKVYHKAKITVGIGHVNDIACGVSDRPFIAMAAGTCHFSRRVPGMEDYFRNGSHWVLWDKIEECVDMIKWILPVEGLRSQIGERGREEVLKNHTWDTRVQEYIGLLKKHFLWSK